MKLTDVQVDGFGVWSGLALNHLSPYCTVFYGPNEAGKSTLLQFMRGVLYGFSPERRLRYLPPLRGGVAGGALTAAVPDEGTLRICRSEAPNLPLGGVSIEASDGTAQGEGRLRQLLHDMEEITFNNIFAVGLRELQELGTLTDTDAARWLYSLTTGIDRVSLFDVQQELERSRLRILPSPTTTASTAERATQVGELLLQRDRLKQELTELAGLSQRHGQLLNDRTVCEQEIAQAQQELTAHDAEHGLLKTTMATYDTWQRRAALDTQLQTISQRNPWPANSAAKMQRITSAIRQRRRRLQKLALRRKELAEEANQITLNDSLCRQSARIEALAEHDSWIVAAEQQLRSAETAAKSLADEKQNQAARLQPATAIQPATARPIDEQTWLALQQPAAILSKARRRLLVLDRQTKGQHATAQNRHQQIQTALAAGPRDLTASLDAAGQRVSQLRRRIQLDGRIDQLAKTKSDLEHRIGLLTEEQILSPRVLIAVGAIFVLGVVLLLSGLVLPNSYTGAWGWPLAWLGFFGTALSLAGKFTLEKTVAAQLEASQKQLALGQTQSKEAVAEREALDRALPKATTPLPQRLQVAEQELAKLEELMPLHSERQEAEHAVAQVELQGADIRQRYHKAVRRWRDGLAAAGLPITLKPRQVRDAMTAGLQLAGLNRRLAEAQADVDRNRRELASLANRIEQTFVAAGIEPPVATSLCDQIRYLRRELAEQENRRQRREAIRIRRQKLRRRHAAAHQQCQKWRRRRAHLLRQCNATDLADFRRRAEEFVRLDSITAQRNAAALEITSQLAGVATEATVANLLTNNTRVQLDDRLAHAAANAEDSRRRLQRLFEQRGQLSEQIRLVGADKRMSVKRFELAQVEKRLAEALRRWQVLTVTGRMLQWIKHEYERSRQPETLRQASEYLVRLTEGRYQRVWTPLGENLLLVDDHEGRAVGIDVLSRGTREQLFLSLRMALVAMFARRGAQLPMILDDVLVNFDGHRAIAAVSVLHDFAAQGHQLLIFTCHEHVAQLFKNQRIDVRRLPSNTEAGHDLPFSIREELPPRRNRVRRAKDDSVPVQQPIAEPPVQSLPETFDIAPEDDDELPEEPAALHRVDPPQQVAPITPVYRQTVHQVAEVEPVAVVEAVESRPRNPRRYIRREVPFVD